MILKILVPKLEVAVTIGMEKKRSLSNPLKSFMILDIFYALKIGFFKRKLKREQGRERKNKKTRTKM
jgi:hypothetical protein